MTKPLVGITPSPSVDEFNHGTFERYALASTYSGAVHAAGGVPIILPPQEGNVAEILDRIDALLLSGGGDIRPERYGDPDVHPKTYGIHDLRDEFEIALAREAIARDIPVLCICRGIQVLNVALGGTLIQDIADQHGTSLEHRQEELGIAKEEPSHEVEVQPGSRLAETYGASTLRVNSFHHQAVRDVGADLRVVGRAPDGIIEALEYAGPAWVLAVQWHPEMMYRRHREHLRPFQALVRAAQERVDRAASLAASRG